MTAFSFNNCGQRSFQGVDSNQGIVVKLDPEQRLALQALPPAERETICHPQALLCTERNYAPGLLPSENIESVCLILDGQEVCFTRKTINYDSSVALQVCADCTRSDGEPGGRYNYVEAYCESPNMNVFLGQELRVYEADLASAVRAYLQECQ